MSPVQVAALEVLMILEQLVESRKNNEQLRLSLMDRDPTRVQQWFPEWFEAKTVSVTTAEEADSLISYELGGGASTWEAGPTTGITPEEVEALIARLSTGQGDLAGGTTDWE